MKGTITTTVRGYAQGNWDAIIKSSEDEVNANGNIEWGNEKLRLTLQLKLPESRFQELDVKVRESFLYIFKYIFTVYHHHLRRNNAFYIRNTFRVVDVKSFSENTNPLRFFLYQCKFINERF